MTFTVATNFHVREVNYMVRLQFFLTQYRVKKDAFTCASWPRIFDVVHFQWPSHAYNYELTECTITNFIINTLDRIFKFQRENIHNYTTNKLLWLW